MIKKKNERLYLLDICRGIAAYCIVIFHYRIFYNENINTLSFERINQPFYNILSPVYETGWIAVQFFFTISGFIFYHLYLHKIKNNKVSWKDFFVFRFSRIYPLHFITLNFILILYLIFILINITTSQFSAINIKHYILNILLISSWGFENSWSFNTPSWSISIEVMLYILFFFISKIKVQIFYSTIFTILFSIFIFYFNKLIGYGIFCFFIGGLTYLTIEKINNYKLKKINLIILSFTISLIVMFFIKKYEITGIYFKILMLTVFFPSLIIFLFFFQKLNKKIGKKICIIGDISYSIYLTHFVIQMITFGILQYNNIKLDFNDKIYFLFYIAIVTTISFFSYYFFEKPMRNFFRKKVQN
jgi:peptidoglycan/LPS O-acetylase OafA/YrhL